MKGALLASLVLAAGCELYVEPDPPPGPTPAPRTYELVPTHNLAGTANINAIAWDGSGLWLVEVSPIGGYWDPDRIALRRLDPDTGAVTAELGLADRWERPTGAVWFEGELWLHHDANTHGLVTSIDPRTGVETRRWSVGSGFGDLDTDGAQVFFADRTINAVVEVRDPVGEIVDVRWSEGFQSSLRGIAVSTPPGALEPELWAGTMASNQLTILVGDERVATATADGLGSNEITLLQFAGARLAIVARNQVFLYDVVRPSP